jgi:hypothetical protein
MSPLCLIARLMVVVFDRRKGSRLLTLPRLHDPDGSLGAPPRTLAGASLPHPQDRFRLGPVPLELIVVAFRRVYGVGRSGAGMSPSGPRNAPATSAPGVPAHPPRLGRRGCASRRGIGDGGSVTWPRMAAHTSDRAARPRASRPPSLPRTTAQDLLLRATSAAPIASAPPMATTKTPTPTETGTTA